MNFDVFETTIDWAHGRGLPTWSAEITGSTNLVAKELAEIGDPLDHEYGIRPAIYLARRQNDGRGRNGRKWENADGALLSSWCYWLSMPPQPILAPLMGLALYEAAQTVFTGVAFSLKAPNDLYIGDKKVAGLLIETVVAGESAKTIIGLGLNVHAHPETLTTSTALNEHADARLTAELFQTFLDALLKNMTAAIRLGQNRKLEFSERARLKDALNRNPLLAEPVLELDALGQIRTASKTITWQEQ